MKTIYKLTRDLSGDREVIHLSTDRKVLADLMRVDIDKWTVPVTYTVEITYDFDDLYQEGRTSAFQDTDTAYYETGRVSAFREAAEFFDGYADTFPSMSVQRSAFRFSGTKMFALMEQEISK